LRNRKNKGEKRWKTFVESIFYGTLKIQTGNADIVIAGGMDSMS
jgi:acetyl-CoA C-acetyltransferase